MTPAELARIHAAAFVETRAWGASEFAGQLDLAGVLLSVEEKAFVLGRVVADEAEILTLACDPAQQRQGYSRAALARFETMARDAGASRVFLEVAESNLAARALYASACYVETGRRPGYYRTVSGQSVAALILAKALSPTDPASNGESLGN